MPLVNTGGRICRPTLAETRWTKNLSRWELEWGIRKIGGGLKNQPHPVRGGFWKTTWAVLYFALVTTSRTLPCKMYIHCVNYVPEFCHPYHMALRGVELHVPWLLSHCSLIALFHLPYNCQVHGCVICRVLTRILKVGVWDFLFVKSRSPSQKVGVPLPQKRSPIFFLWLSFDIEHVPSNFILLL